MPAPATPKNASAQKTANMDSVDTDYKLAVENCKAFASDVKTQCVADAKLKYRK